jgi:hypothetical protein
MKEQAPGKVALVDGRLCRFKPADALLAFLSATDYAEYLPHRRPGPLSVARRTRHNPAPGIRPGNGHCQFKILFHLFSSMW